MREKLIVVFLLMIVFGASGLSAQQYLSLEKAIDTAITNYGTIRAKEAYTQAALTRVEQQKRAYLPNLYLSAQNNFGTVNGQNGPLYAFGGQALASSGLPLAEQNWNAAFGALYLANFNWEFFTFGRVKAGIQTAEAGTVKYQRDQEQEVFNHKIKVTSAYLNLVAARKLSDSYRKNLERADTLYKVVTARARSGLIAGVDSVQAKAEVSSARIQLTQAIDKEQRQAKDLAVLLGISNSEFVLDSLFFQKAPSIPLENEQVDPESHPLTLWYASRITEAEQQRKYLKRTNYPSLILGAAYQARGSGFFSNYAQDQTAYTQNYLDGINPVRGNYVVALGITWNFTQPFRTASLVKEQDYLLSGLRAEHDMTRQQLHEELALSERNIANALATYHEVPTQLEAASLAYRQKRVRYENGLTDLVDVS
ncbi:TolC family protein [Olivibacter sitiensis]|uniref:TolC family protein n=1 Tax=Olivibacter sitiensis TaxID=376470 RepID=UPI0004243355|nr:TolC family protein [Olivibacter sitiensis]